MRPSRRGLIWTAVVVVTALAVVAVLIATGVVWPNRLFAAKYDVRGADVSHHQGPIDWDEVADEDIDFAYIKATEGTTHVDDRFTENWEDAQDAGIVVGAHHFMSFDSPGTGQAENLIATVPETSGMLPPVVDVESYGRYIDDLPDEETVSSILDELLAGLEDQYGVPAIIYTTDTYYDAFIRDAYPDNPIWIRAIVLPPRLSDDRDWTFWQYSNRDHLDGIEGYVDMNVYAGTSEEFEELRLQ